MTFPNSKTTKAELVNAMNQWKAKCETETAELAKERDRRAICEQEWQKLKTDLAAKDKLLESTRAGEQVVTKELLDLKLKLERAEDLHAITRKENSLLRKLLRTIVKEIQRADANGQSQWMSILGAASAFIAAPMIWGLLSRGKKAARKVQGAPSGLGSLLDNLKLGSKRGDPNAAYSATGIRLDEVAK